MPSPVFSLLGLIYLILAPRARATYVLTSLALLALSYDAVLNSYRQWQWSGPYQTWPMFEIGAQAGFILLFFYLPIRFIFGHPSRRYYGMITAPVSSNL